MNTNEMGAEPKLTTTDAEKAETLSTFFSSVFTTEPVDELPTFIHQTHEQHLHLGPIENQQVHTYPKNLNVNKSKGPNNIHPRVLKELCGILSYP